MKCSKELLLFLSHLDFIKANEKIALVEKGFTFETLSKLSLNDFAYVLGRPLTSSDFCAHTFARQLEKDFSVLQAYDIHIISFWDEDYPPLLKEIYDSPLCLFVRGDIGCLKRNTLGIVGTRYPSFDSMKQTFSFAKESVENGFCIVSGLANGIDTYAHKGALEGYFSLREQKKEIFGATCGVLAGGVDGIYPSSNKKLAANILKFGGCLVSEYPPFSESFKWRFPKRNRIISGLSQGLVVMQAPPGSGALITVDFALEQNREVFFHENVLTDYQEKKSSSKRSARKYIEDGANVIKTFQDISINSCIKTIQQLLLDL
ncbi:MAG: DNA-protecting protein DprA [Spirochaetaceae bacterium]|nr:DNA-protecting protein DprA [Spirochaetaceae bacterium]